MLLSKTALRDRFLKATFWTVVVFCTLWRRHASHWPFLRRSGIEEQRKITEHIHDIRQVLVTVTSTVDGCDNACLQPKTVRFMANIGGKVQRTSEQSAYSSRVFQQFIGKITEHRIFLAYSLVERYHYLQLTPRINARRNLFLLDFVKNLPI